QTLASMVSIRSPSHCQYSTRHRLRPWSIASRKGISDAKEILPCISGARRWSRGRLLERSYNLGNARRQICEQASLINRSEFIHQTLHLLERSVYHVALLFGISRSQITSWTFTMQFPAKRQ